MDGSISWLSLPAELASLERFTDFVRAVSREVVPEPDFAYLELILEEVLVNVFRHAYAEHEHGTVAVGCSIDATSGFHVMVRDRGRAYNPLDAPAPDLTQSIEDRPIGGLGVFLVRRLADSVTYRREHDENVLSFHFRPKDRGGAAQGQ
jgi:anti-sigma regulatory factor (Ser/Thr protein kinase)